MIFVIIAAGGTGQRLGSREGKQLLPLLGRPMISYSLSFFEGIDFVEGVIISAGRSILAQVRQLVESEQLFKVIAVVEAGKERIDSVWAGLAAVPPQARYIAVHDGARPVVTRDLFDRLVDAIEAGDYDGVVPAIPLKNTVKKAVNGEVVETLNRPELFGVQTPQVFLAGKLRGAYERLSASRASFSSFTDDASIVEFAGGKIGVVEGDEKNLKVTTPLDAEIAEMILGARE